MTIDIQQGDKASLNHSLKAKQRIIAGLSWDAREDKVGMIGKLLKSDSQHDLDICCYIYDNNGEFIDFVGAEAQDSMDQTGKIYHSGDDMSGEGDGDDERISIELAELPSSIHAIVFMAEIRSNHVFNEIEGVTARIVDSFTEKKLLSLTLNHPDSENKNACVLVSVYRDNVNSKTGWMLHHIAKYPDISKIQDWGEYLKQYTR